MNSIRVIPPCFCGLQIRASEGKIVLAKVLVNAKEFHLAASFTDTNCASPSAIASATSKLLQKRLIRKIWRTELSTYRSERRRVYIAYTGGTIGMTNTGEGYAPAPGFLETRLREMPELRDAAMPEIVLHEYTPLLDSSNMTPREWFTIARDIFENYDAFDGFVVLHGTDTMAYTASALPFLLQGLTKPVILTGSQIPLVELRNDARENLITALLIAANQPLPEVCLYFGDKLLRGCRTVKVNALGFGAFESPNYPPLGTVGIDIQIDWSVVRAAPLRALEMPRAELNATVAALRLFPGISAELLRNVLQTPLQGLVLETYGAGNAPNRDRALLNTLAEATQRGAVIVDCTQCLRGAVKLNAYATGAALLEAGVISGADMTPIAALTKLHYLIGSGYASEQVRALMQQNLSGEVTL
ncbi:MAG: asparaginase [Chloroflexi bacterium]|nr:asparaginase [Chloroflexota bacterium]